MPASSPLPFLHEVVLGPVPLPDGVAARWPDGIRTLDVRRPLPIDDGELFAARGFDLAATHPGHPDGPHGWPGEPRWVRAADSTP